MSYTLVLIFWNFHLLPSYWCKIKVHLGSVIKNWVCNLLCKVTIMEAIQNKCRYVGQKKSKLTKIWINKLLNLPCQIFWKETGHCRYPTIKKSRRIFNKVYVLIKNRIVWFSDETKRKRGQSQIEIFKNTLKND